MNKINKSIFALRDGDLYLQMSGPMGQPLTTDYFHAAKFWMSEVVAKSMALSINEQWEGANFKVVEFRVTEV